MKSKRELSVVQQSFVPSYPPESNKTTEQQDREALKLFERNTSLINNFMGQMIKMDQ
jgi:hypothetical protein